MQWTALYLKTKPNQHLAGKYDTNQKQKKASHFWRKKRYSVRHFTSVLTTARETPKSKEKNPEKMCQLIFLKIYPQYQKQ